MSDQPQTTPAADPSWAPVTQPADTAGQVTTPAPAQPTPRATPSADERIAELEKQLANALEAQKPADPSAKAASAPAVAPDFKVGQLVGYSEDYLGYDVARFGIVVGIEKSELVDGSEKYFARVVPQGPALHLPADQLTVQD